MLNQEEKKANGNPSAGLNDAESMILASKMGICSNCEVGSTCVNVKENTPVWHCNEHV